MVDITKLDGETFAAWAMRVWDWDLIGDDDGAWDDVDDDDTATSSLCPVCGGEGALLGTLGHVTSYRCRDCGTVYQQPSA
jgi:predicted RNA-binding Zn-ribbon protein involved in translation (DUF1610 family)